MVTNIKYIFIVILSFLFFSCNKQRDKELSYILLFNPESSNVIEKSLILDSILIKNYSNDSILFSKYSNGRYIESFYFNSNGEFWEERIKGNDYGKFLGIDSILTFSKKDTTFMYKSVREFIVLVPELSLASCKYSILKEGNEFKTIKQSLVDTTYKEFFYYDKDYRIYKFVNTWKDNTCVYVKKY